MDQALLRHIDGEILVMFFLLVLFLGYPVYCVQRQVKKKVMGHYYSSVQKIDRLTERENNKGRGNPLVAWKLKSP